MKPFFQASFWALVVGSLSVDYDLGNQKIRGGYEDRPANRAEHEPPIDALGLGRPRLPFPGGETYQGTEATPFLHAIVPVVIARLQLSRPDQGLQVLPAKGADF